MAALIRRRPWDLGGITRLIRIAIEGGEIGLMRKTACVFILLSAAMLCRAVTVIIPEKARPSTAYAAEELAEHLHIPESGTGRE